MQGRRLRFSAVRDIGWETFVVPDRLQPSEILVQAECSLISVGTEMAVFTGTHIGYTLPDPPFQLMPSNPGYALVGRIMAAGSAVEGVEEGTRVLVEAPHGDLALIDTRAKVVLPLPDALDPETATLVRMAYIALTAVRVAPLQLGETVAVFGLGHVGQLAAQLFTLNGARIVFGVDRLDARLNVAARHGIRPLAPSTGSGRDAALAALLAATDGLGCDVVVEASGNPQVVPHALAATRRGGRMVQLGSTRGRAEIDLYSHVHRRGIHLLGAHETVHGLDNVPSVRWSKLENMHLLARLFLDERLGSEGLLDRTVAPDEAISLYRHLADHPHDHLGVLIDWRAANRGLSRSA